MELRRKVWLGIGTFALVGGASGWLESSALQGTMHGIVPAAMAQTEGGEAGEGGEGGEGGGVPGSYALSSTDANAYAYDAAPQIASYVDLVRSSYAKAADDGRALRGAIDAFLAEPNGATLAQARAAWLNARPAYLRTETFRFYDGPIEEIEGRINAWPLNEAFIDYVEGDADAGLVNDTSMDLSRELILDKDQVTDEANVTTGWHAIEFLLWGQDRSTEGPGARPADDYMPGVGNNDRRRQYLKLVTDQLVADLGAMTDAWSTDGADTYASKLLAMPQREALGRILNGMAILAGFEMMSERLAVALDSGDQEDEHSCFSDNTVADFVYDLRGIRDVWFGDAGGNDGAGLDTLVRAQDAALADRMTALLNRTEAALADLDHPFDRVLAAPADSAPRQQAEMAVRALSDLGEGLRDVGTKLGVLVLLPS